MPRVPLHFSLLYFSAPRCEGRERRTLLSRLRRFNYFGMQAVLLAERKRTDVREKGQTPSSSSSPKAVRGKTVAMGSHHLLPKQRAPFT
ncbi:hypothetical protein GW17_00059582 [Ensete ventricosum]|nr:hypothetical protein GW17_00059582 [Ensete ventricosum]